MKMSCLCLTYNRPSTNHLVLLEEAVESFIRQDYPDKELIIVNDCPGQQLIFDHPQVKIFNLEYRTLTLGRKRNLAAQLASGEVIMDWDDDDISLPWRLSLCYEMMKDGTDYFNPKGYFFLSPAGLRSDCNNGYAHNCSAYRLDAYEKVGGIPMGLARATDAAMYERLAYDKRLRHKIGPLPVEKWFYIYRWGVSPVHLSGMPGNDNEGYRAIGQRPILSGSFLLQPHWRQDYLQMVRDHLQKMQDTAKKTAGTVQ